MHQIEVKYLKIKSSTFNKITSYLSKRPYNEVCNLFDEFKTGIVVELGDTNVPKKENKKPEEESK